MTWKYFKYQLLTGLLAGTLDGLAAIIILAKMRAQAVFRSIAGVLIGREKAHNGGPDIVLLGVILHFFVAVSFTLLFFWLYGKLKVVRVHKVLTAIVYAFFVWVAMNLIILPIFSVNPDLILWKVLRDIAILIFAISTPLTLLAEYAWRKKLFPQH